ncbi:MAG: hypothetical protein A3J63_02910 [Candidatus Moranbacteria bacterium RIFCSPHIGHO2_02_FULL_40_12b]|nr:MAG: hypothetical protein A3J63_02910 [Candidatus Moranbacteria bacterium RIFCSPHIGHO2_02_FULL_40_12b]OGI23881.1 MAG: hypothetical protein A3E91_00625 [Candidatus Moranbacteria bacterium RIFCSPHIGHO2_12_FULL_40_10]
MLNIPKQFSSFKFIRPIQWPEIFDAWRSGEARQESWKRHWEERGFGSWDEWRTEYAKPFQPETLNWFLYEISDPTREFPEIYCVPSKSWIEKAYGGKITKQFKDIAGDPIIKDNNKIIAIKNDFPKKTMLTGLLCGEKIVLVEGMHRAAALATWDSKVPFNSKIYMAIAEWNKEIPIIGGNYKK